MLEPVPRARRGDDDVLHVGVMINDEPGVLHTGVKAHLGLHAIFVEAREERPDIGSEHPSDFVRTNATANRVGRRRILILLGGDLHPLFGVANQWKAVDALGCRKLPDVHRKSLWKKFRVSVLVFQAKPIKHLPRYAELPINAYYLV